MKINVLSLIIGAFIFVSINVNAQKILSNVDTTECSIKKEMTMFCQSGSKPLLKKIYYYDLSGLRLSHAVYLWDDKNGWVEHQEYIYTYSDNQLIAILFRNKNNDDSPETQYNLLYTYDDAGMLLTIKYVREKNIVNNENDFKL